MKAMSIVRIIPLGISLLMAIGVILSGPSLAAQTAKDEVCKGIGLTANGSGSCDNPPGQANVESVMPKIINILSVVVGVISVIVLIIGGLKFITSTGDASQVTSARNTIIYALVGLVIVLLAQFIVRYVVKSVA